MKYHLICVHPFAHYVKGQLIKDPDLVDSLSEKRAHHFVKILAPEPAAPATPESGEE